MGPLPVVPIATSNDPLADVTFTFPDGSSATHKARRANATAALRDAMRLAASRSAIENSGSYAGQAEGTRSLFRAIGQFYKDANVIPQSDPVYVQWWRDWFATGTVDGFDTVVPIDFEDPTWARVNGVGKTSAKGVNPRGGIAERLKKQWLTLGKSLPNDSYIGPYPIRMLLNETGDLIELCPGTFGSPRLDGGRDVTGEGPWCDWSPGALYTGCAADGATREGCESYKWSTMIWHDPPPWPGRAEESYERFRALPPLSWFFDAAADLVGRIANRQSEYTNDVATATWLSALRYAAQWNVVTARALNVLPSELEAFSANIPRNRRLDQLAAQESNMAAAAEFSATAMTVGSAFGPYGTLLAAMAGALATIEAAIFPPAVATRTDFFGRLMPIALKVGMEGATTIAAPTVTSDETVHEAVHVSAIHAPRLQATGMSSGTKIALAVAALGVVGTIGYVAWQARDGAREA